VSSAATRGAGLPLRRWAGLLLDPSPATMRRLALAGVLASAGIVVTGAAVRLSNSGLGCLDWPTCTRASLVAARRAGEPLFHTWIEFGNRTLTGVVEAVAVLVLIAAWRYRGPGPGPRTRRRDLVGLAALQPAGVVLQAVIGGIVVLTKLNPGWVAAHFLVSAAVVAAAVLLYVRCTEGTGPARWLVRRELRLLGSGVVALTAAMLAAGTVVTGTGPLAGAPGVPRFPLSLPAVTQFHADIGWLLGGGVFALALGLRLTGAPARLARLGYLLLGLLACQGVIGYAQYFAHLPAGLVWVHESASMLIWVTVLRLRLAMREREPSPRPFPQAGEATTRAAR
jgi:cytochrome c oxidase assembly protein subunit 15